MFWGVGATERPFYDAGHVYKPAAINEYKWEISYFQNTYKRSPFHFRFLFLEHVKEICECEREWYADTGKSKAGEKERQGKDAVQCMQLTR